MFELLRFNTRFFRARLREIVRNDFQGAADLLDQCAVPEKFRSLRDAYRLRMLVLAHSPKLGPNIITAAQAFPWFQNPKSAGDRYARDYCQYVAAAVRGDAAERKRRAQELARLSVRSIYRNSLRVTD
jgi:hypothetical protein